MTDLQIPGRHPGNGSGVPARVRAWRWDPLYRFGGGFVAAVVPAVLLAIFVFLLTDGLPALRFMGIRFFTTSTWNPGSPYVVALAHHGGETAMAGASFGAFPLIVGTLFTSAIALLIAVPVALGAAFFLSEWVPARLEPVLSTLLQLLSGVPSVVYGLWGLAVVVPVVAHDLGPWLSHVFGFLPFLAGPVGTGLGLLSTGLVLAVMILPLVASVSRDAMRETPTALREGALALGLTRWEATRSIVLHHARTAVLGAGILGLGRALGETMAVLMLSGGAMGFVPQNLYGPVSTLASVVASHLDSAFADPTHMAVHALAAAALVLLCLSLVVNAIARVIVREGVVP